MPSSRIVHQWKSKGFLIKNTWSYLLIYFRQSDTQSSAKRFQFLLQNGENHPELSSIRHINVSASLNPPCSPPIKGWESCRKCKLQNHRGTNKSTGAMTHSNIWRINTLPSPQVFPCQTFFCPSSSPLICLFLHLPWGLIRVVSAGRKICLRHEVTKENIFFLQGSKQAVWIPVEVKQGALTENSWGLCHKWHISLHHISGDLCPGTCQESPFTWG